jgi:hypothetical protein
MVKIRREIIAYCKFPVLETKANLTDEEYETLSVLSEAKESEWYNLIEDYGYFVAQANTSAYRPS